MNKLIGLICILIAVCGLSWKFYAAAQTINGPRNEVTFRETSYDPEGNITAQKKTVKKMVTVTRLKVNEGAELLIGPDGPSLQSAGTMTIEAPIFTQVNDLTWWAMVATNLAAGFYLLRKKKLVAD